MCIQKRTFFAGVTVFFAGAAFLKTALICNFVANTIFILYFMFCDDVACDNGEVFVPLFCLFHEFRVSKNAFFFISSSLSLART